MSNHRCGFHYTTATYQRVYLPLLSVRAHASILSTTSRITFTQTFNNVSKDQLKHVTYSFPLYDGVSVVAFTCTVNERVMKGVVEEKEDARRTYIEATARGEIAGLLEQSLDASDVFTTTVGNIPAHSKIDVVIEVLGELKCDAEADNSIRFTIPTQTAPRYGFNSQTRVERDSIDADTQDVGGIEIVVDAKMPGGCAIKQMQSTTHPIAVTMGTISTAPSAAPEMCMASATLSLGDSALDKDFVLQVMAKDFGVPKAILESHPTIAGQRALMATLVPKFTLPPQLVEIVFICDRSGSMAGSSMKAAKSALKVFLKSLPIGIKFNICSFGSNHTFLWPKAKTYDQPTLEEAIRHAETFDADYGGTETFGAVKATLDRRHKDIPLEVMLLTDGQIWDQQGLFSYLNKEVIESKAPIRVFTLGIGSSVSSGLIEGVARAGNGFSQLVSSGEKLEKKIVRMLKGALSPHVKDFRLELQYGSETTNGDDFEMVEEPAEPRDEMGKTDKPDGLPAANTRQKRKSISLYDDQKSNDDDPVKTRLKIGDDQLGPLPSVTSPRILQSPFHMPPLFAFNTTTVYLLLSAEDAGRTIKSLTLRGTTANEDELKLEVPVQTLDLPGDTIHRLAVKNITAELEEGRGWIHEAKDEDGQFLKDKYESRFQDMIRRETVELGVRYQVSGKWCSWVAVEDSPKVSEREISRSPFAPQMSVDFDSCKASGIAAEAATGSASPSSAMTQQTMAGRTAGLFGAQGAQSYGRQRYGQAQSEEYEEDCEEDFSGFDNVSKQIDSNTALPHRPQPANQRVFDHASSMAGTSGSPFGELPSMIGTSGGLLGISPSMAGTSGGLFGTSPSMATKEQFAGNPARNWLGGTAARKSRLSQPMMQQQVDRMQRQAGILPGDHEDEDEELSGSSTDTRTPLEKLIDFQSFDGHWKASENLRAVIDSRGVGVDQLIAGMKWGSTEQHENIAATALVIGYLELELTKDKDSWELVAEKARAWIKAAIGVAEAEVLLEKVMKLMS